MTKVTKPIAGHYDLAVLCKLAYAKPDQAIAAYKDLGYEVSTQKNGEMYVLDKAIIVFRGSDNVRDWISNLTAVKTPGGRHMGFWRRYCSYSLGGIANKDTIFTGHSLGAAMAVYAASQFDATAITFGEPMNADLDLMQGLVHIRYVNNMDIVPKLPPAGYVHSGELRYLDYYGKMHINPSRWLVVRDRILSRFKAISKWEKFDDLYDHQMKEYLDKLK